MPTLPAIESVDDDELEAMIVRAWREAARSTREAMLALNGPLEAMLCESADSAIHYHLALRDEWQRRHGA